MRTDSVRHTGRVIASWPPGIIVIIEFLLAKNLRSSTLSYIVVYISSIRCVQSCQSSQALPAVNLILACLVHSDWTGKRQFVCQHNASTLKVLLSHRHMYSSMTTCHEKTTACLMTLTDSSGIVCVCKVFNTTYKAGQETEHLDPSASNHSNAALRTAQYSKSQPFPELNRDTRKISIWHESTCVHQMSARWQLFVQACV